MPTLIDDPDVARSTATPGMMVSWVPATPPGSVGIRWMADQVEPFVDVVYTRSFVEHPLRKRQSSQTRKILPSPEISADGSGPLRMLPGSFAAVMFEIVNEAICPASAGLKSEFTPARCGTLMKLLP